VSAHPHVTEKLLTLLLRANQFLAEHPKDAAPLVAAWLGEKPEVEALSLPTIRYLVAYDKEWERGVEAWLTDMIKNGKLTGAVKNARGSGNLPGVIYDLETHARASKNL
jgi:ABC-type nitrate/sulfonate/bicarbonate transport system substrate-binding protein